MRVSETTRSELRTYVQMSDKPVAQLAAELGVSKTTIRRWRAPDRPKQSTDSATTNNDRAPSAIAGTPPNTLPVVYAAGSFAAPPAAGKRRSVVGLGRYALALWLLGAVVYAASTQAFVRASELFAQKDQTVGASVKRPAAVRPTAPPPRDAERAARAQAPTAVVHALAASNTDAPGSTRRDAGSDAGGEWVEVTGTGVNMRAAPTSGSRVVTVQSLGSKLRIVSQDRSGWVEVVDPDSGQQGWIFRKYAKPATSPGDQRNGAPTTAIKDVPQQNQF
jgi:hypothetical protein